MKENTFVILFSVFLFVLVITAARIMIEMNKTEATCNIEEKEYYRLDENGEIVDNIPSVEGLIPGSDLIFGDKNAYFAELSSNDLPHYMVSNGFYYSGTVDNDNGVVILHPVSIEVPAFFQTFVDVGNDTMTDYYLYIKIANIAGKVRFAKDEGCNDNIFEIHVSGVRSGVDKMLDKFVINSKDGWIIKRYNINYFKGQRVYITILSRAGGPCGKWYSEWGAIGYVNVFAFPQ